MTKEAKSNPSNAHQERALWLRDAVQLLRPDFEKSGLPLPEKIRLGFSTKGKGTQKTGECWHDVASADGAFEIFIRADQSEPLKVLSILARELVHAALPVTDSHGKKFKFAAMKIGLVGKMREAVPGHLLEARLRQIAADLGDLPHASLNIDWVPIAKRKTQKTYMLKACCPGKNDDQGVFQECGYTVRLAAKWAKEFGAWCPRHGAILVEMPPDLPESELDPAQGADLNEETQTEHDSEAIVI